MRALYFALAISLVCTWPRLTHSQSATESELASAKSVVARYCSAWSEVDPANREIAIAAIWGERAEYMDSQPVHLTGREALVAEIVKFQQQFPGAHFRCDAVRAHHGFVGYTWSLVMTDGTERFSGMDFGEIDSAGRLVRIVSFFDMPQAPE